MRENTMPSTGIRATMSAAAVVEGDLDYICSNLKDEFASFSGTHVLLTGGAGFLGYYLVQSILHWNKVVAEPERIRLTVYDNYARGVPRWLTELRNDTALTLVTQDITKPLPREMPGFQYVIHAASIASPTYYRKHPIDTMDANVNGLRALLEYFRSLRDAHKATAGFLFFSSSEIYGDPSPENIPTPEEYRGNVSCTGPRACYDEAKRYGETLCVNFARHYGLPIKVTRPFNNYGPGLKISDRRVIPDFARDIRLGRDVVMLSDGSPMRTFCYVADAVIGYYKVLANGRAGEAYNIGVEAPEISVADVAERLVSIARELFGYRGGVVRQPSADRDYLVDNPNRRCPRIAKARFELGFSPTVSLDEGLRRLLIWYSENHDAEDA
jgi:nucleoside-diphosphate-sugar epimerase